MSVSQKILDVIDKKLIKEDILPNGSEIKTTKLNREVVHPIIIPDVKKKPRHYPLFAMPYFSAVLTAKKKSGKTSALAKIISKCIGTGTKIVCFCSTLNKDPSWEIIKQYCIDHGNEFDGFTEIGSNLKKYLPAEEDCESDEDTDQPAFSSVIPSVDFKTTDSMTQEELDQKLFGEPEPSVEEEKKPKSKYLIPEYLFIFDDLGKELRHKDVASLLKVHRHMFADCLISCHHLCDMAPDSWAQIDYLLIFKNIDDEKLKRLHMQCSIALPFETWMKLYKFATHDKFNFLYTRLDGEEEFRKNFTDQLTLGGPIA